MDETKALTTPRKSLKDLLGADNFKQAVKDALPRHLSPDRFIRVAITALTRTPKLQKCTPESFFKCLLDLSAMGLEPDGRNAHLIPFENRRAGTVECTLLVDYKGLTQLVRRSGEVSYIHADVVYEGDEFDFAYGSGAFLRHKPNLNGERVKRKAAYSFVKMKDGSEDFMVWGMSQVEAIRQRSRSKDDGPWSTGNKPGGDYDEMAKKSVFRNQSKWLPFSPEVHEIIHRDDDAIDIEGSFELPADGGSEEAAKAIAEAKKSELRKAADIAKDAIAKEPEPVDRIANYRNVIADDARFKSVIDKHLKLNEVATVQDIPLGDAANAVYYDLEDVLKEVRAERAAADEKAGGKKQSRLSL